MMLRLRRARDPAPEAKMTKLKDIIGHQHHDDDPIQRMDTYVLGPCMLISEACMCTYTYKADICDIQSSADTYVLQHAYILYYSST